MKLTYLLFALLLISNPGFSQNFHNHSNAASIENEDDSVDGWTGPAEIESKDDDPHHGEYVIKIKSEEDEGRHAEYSFNADPGTTYAITIWAKKGENSSNPVFDNWQGFTGFETTNITGQGWNDYLFIVTATTNNPKIRVYASKNEQDDREVYIDAVSIFVYEEEDDIPPTSPSNLSTSGITTSSVTLSWSGSNDNVGVAGYKIYRNNTSIGETSSLSYNVTGLSGNTNYTFYVKAYDEAMNYSPASNSVSITTPANGGGGGGNGTGTAYTNENANLPTVNWQALNMYAAGSVGIGTSPSESFRLAVNGRIRAKEVIVETGWSDFVFKPDYDLPSIKEVKDHISIHGHLKDIPSEMEVLENGIEVGEMNKLLLQKVEEMTLYLIEAYDRIEVLENRINEINVGEAKSIHK